MAAERNSGAAIVALALDFHRAPTRHADLLHGRAPLPPAVATLLKLAGGSEADPEWGGLAPAEELQAAALFFIEQAQLHHDSDHYRVLGLAPDASSEQIKEHHRLLMRVFHPDRENRVDDWKDAFATRINLAYTALREPESRRRYDATFTTAARPGLNPPVARRFAPKPVLPRSRTHGLPPMLLRYLPQWVLAGSALIAAVIVGAVYLNNPPVPAMRQQASAPGVVAVRTGRAVPAEAMAAQQAKATDSPPRPVAPLAPAASLMRTAPPPHQPQPVPAAAKVRPLRAADAFSQDARPAPPAPARVQRLRAAPDALPQPAASPIMQVAARAEPAAPPLQTAQPADLATRPETPDPDATLAQFMAAFEHGDTQAFMALFDEVALGRAGGKSNIRREHESLFRATELRHIAIDGMAWSRDGDWIRGEGRYRTTLMRKGELVLRTETGVFRIQLVRRGDQALIMGLDLQPGGPS